MEAERIAREIESAPTRNYHLAEERGQVIGADDQDEEARFSSVLRSEAPKEHASIDARNADTFGAQYGRGRERALFLKDTLLSCLAL